MKVRRFWLVILYGLATLMVQGLHDHGRDRAEPVAVGLAGCDDPRPHVSGHRASELTPTDLHCLACQFGADHQAVWPGSFATTDDPGGLVAGFESRAHRAPAVARSTCRGPPLA